VSASSLKRLLLKGVSLINEGSLKRGHKDRDERNGPGAETEEGGHSICKRIESGSEKGNCGGRLELASSIRSSIQG
jgi:hypothetical protein